jgi:hypothetical protein
MLVGDHGRVIPFRHFKALIVGVGGVLILSLCALILLGVLYTRQHGRISKLQEDLEQMRAQSTKFRDEKDLYLTRLKALQMKTGVLPQKPVDAPPAVAEKSQSQTDTKEPPATEKVSDHVEKAEPETEEAQKEIPVQKAEPRVRWSAEIRNFKASYDNRQGVLTAEFRIYNTSQPKKRLSGRTVVIFKAIGDPPSRWEVVPKVPLQNETPAGKEGRVFQIRNYQTERFKTLRQKKSPEYEIASVYIFEEQGGKLIGNKELPFNVDYSPPTPPKPVVAPHKAEPEKPTGPSQVQQVESTSPVQSTPGHSMTPDSAPGREEPPVTTKSPEAQSGPPNPVTPPVEEQPESQIEADGSGTSTPEAPEALTPTPAAEPKPAQEGETK